MTSLVLLAAVAGCGTEPPETRPDEVVSQLRPRLGSPGTLEIRAPDAPGVVVTVDVDGDDVFTLTSSESEAQALVDTLEGLDRLYPCLGTFGELGPLEALCASIADDREVVVEVTAVPNQKGDVVAWSELDRFDPGCVATESPDVLRCTLTDTGPVLSPLATFTPPEEPPPPPPGDCVPTVAAAGNVDSIAPWGDKLIIGGSFLEGIVQTWPGPIGMADDGLTVVECPPGPDGEFGRIVDIVEDDDGSLLISGSFGSYGGEDACDGVARIAPDGTVDVAFCEAMPATLGGTLLARAGSVLYVGDASGVFAFDLDALDVLATSPAFTIQAEQTLTDLAVVGDAVYVAGRGLSQIGAQVVSGLGALDADDLGALPFAPAFDATVQRLAANGDELWVGGGFTTVDGQPQVGLAVFDATTRAQTAFDADLDGPVSDLFVGPDGVWVAGTFGAVGGQPRSGVARLGGDGSLAPDDLPLARAVLPVSVTSVVEVDGVVAVSGSFDEVDGAPQRWLARFDRATGDPLAVTAVRNPPTLYAIDDQLWANAPSGIGLVERAGAVILDPATGEVDPLDFELDGQLSEVFVDGDVVYLTGFFSTVRGVARSRIAAVDLLTGDVLPFAPTVDSSVADVAFGPDTVYIGGFFSTVNGEARPSFAALNKSDGTSKPGFSALLDIQSNVRALALFGDDVIVGGLIGTVNGVDRGDLVWVDAQTGANSPVSTSVQTATPVAELFDGELWVESSTSAVVSGLPEDDELFAIDPATGTLRNWQPGMQGGSVDSLLKIGDVVIVAGFEIRIDGVTSRIWALDATTAAVIPWAPPVEGDPRVVLAYDDQVLIGTTSGQLLFVDPPR